MCLGAAAGSFLGQSASLAAVGAQSPGGSPDAVVWLFGAIGYAGATLLAAGVGALSAVTARRLPRSVVTLCCLLISGLLFALVAWYVMALGSAWTGIGWSGLRAMLAFDWLGATRDCLRGPRAPHRALAPGGPGRGLDVAGLGFRRPGGYPSHGGVQPLVAEFSERPLAPRWRHRVLSRSTGGATVRP